MKKTLRLIGLVFLILIVALFAFYMVKNESLPEGTASTEADALAQKMMQAMNKAAWDSTKSVSWTFRGEHDYEWNRVDHTVVVTWGDYRVLLNPAEQSGEVYLNNELLREEKAAPYVKQAWDFFNNDSFWLAAPFKAFDPGTERRIVECADGREGLMVTYTSGGTTPGDSYVWILGDDFRPVACKMWVDIIPIGGIEFTWEDYTTLPGGAMVARQHKALGLLNVDLSEIK